MPPSVRQLLRPSIRLKTTLYTLSLGIFILVILALNAGAQLSRPTPQPINTALAKVANPNAGAGAGGLSGEGDDGLGIELADTGEGQEVARGKDAHLIEGDVHRSFEEPDFALLSATQPSLIGCDIPLRREGAQGLDGEDEGVLLFLGIFSAAKSRERRDLYRTVLINEFPSDLVTTKFILARPYYNESLVPPVPQEERELLLAQIEEEMAEHGDMVMLPIIDNIDAGKTYEYFRWVAKEYAGEGRVKGRPRFVMKADDDTILVMPNIMSAFRNLDCAENVYWGTSAGRSHYFGEYFRGLAYAMSWPLVSWIGNADMPYAHIIKIEDARTGQWLRHLDPVTDPIHRVDMGWTMGDWNQIDIGLETVALHWAKLNEWVIDLHDRLLSTWSAAGRPWSPDHGLPPKDSIAKGRIVPKGAEEEHRRQKELGWDVDGNMALQDYKKVQNR